MTSGFRPTWVEVDLEAVRHNVRALTPPNAQLMAVVKADAYGHGDVPVARAALEAGASWLGVALVEEGIALRKAGIDAPILVLSEFPLGSESEALAADLTPSLYTRAALARLSEAAVGRGIGVHVKVDTGMHRVGIWPPEATVDFLDEVAAAGLEPEGLWTHFARSEEDPLTTATQLALFLEVVEAARARGHSPRLLHAANSAATILNPEAHLDLVRPGIAIYGVEPAAGIGSSLGLRPTLRWRTAVSMFKRLRAGERVSYGHAYRLETDSWVGIVPVGYADGYPRALSSRADVLLRGRRCRVAGNVTMDQVIIDCGELKPEMGEEVVLLGRQGAQEITATELAHHAETIAYEILTGIGGRVPREFSG